MRAERAAAEAQQPIVEQPAVAEVAPELIPRAEAVVEQPAVTPTLDAAAQAPAPTPFLKRSSAGKMEVLADVMGDARGMLDANGVSEKVENRLAATIPQELSENGARKGLGYGFLKQARGLNEAMAKVDRNDPAAMAKARGKLNEDQRHLLDSGIDLSTLPEDLSKTPADLRDQITSSGVELRAAQYGEMSDLMAKGKTEKLGKTDAARLASLKGTKGMGMKYNGYDPTMGDLEGMSSERFAEIFAPGNSRFEPVQYKQLRSSYRKNLASNEAQAAAFAKDPKKKAPRETVLAESGIGDFEMSTAGQADLAGDLDTFADMATSYGPGQIMGGYAQSDLFRGRNKAERLAPVKNEDGTESTTTLAELKETGTRMEPTADDIRPMLGLIQMKGIDPGGSPTIPQWISAYNGNPNSTQRAQYTNSLTDNGALYDSAKKARAE